MTKSTLPSAWPGLGKPANPQVKLKKGFAVMDPLLQREIASLGGKAAHEKGTAYQFTSETARLAALKRGRK